MPRLVEEILTVGIMHELAALSSVDTVFGQRGLSPSLPLGEPENGLVVLKIEAYEFHKRSIRTEVCIRVARYQLDKPQGITKVTTAAKLTGIQTGRSFYGDTKVSPKLDPRP